MIGKYVVSALDNCLRRRHSGKGLLMPKNGGLGIENVVDLLPDSLTVILTLGTALALVISRNVDKGVTMYVVDSRLNNPQTAWGLQRVVYLEAQFGESPSQVAQSLQWKLSLLAFLGASSVVPPRPNCGDRSYSVGSRVSWRYARV